MEIANLAYAPEGRTVLWLALSEEQHEEILVEYCPLEDRALAVYPWLVSPEIAGWLEASEEARDIASRRYESWEREVR